MSKKKNERSFVIRAYCSDCGRLCLESNPLYKKELLASWDNAVVGATSIRCEHCKSKVPNFHIDLKIYNRASKIEYKPSDLIPLNESMADTITSLVGLIKDTQDKNIKETYGKTPDEERNSTPISKQYVSPKVAIESRKTFFRDLEEKAVSE